MSNPHTYDFLVGTFNTPHLYSLRFTLPPSSSTTPPPKSSSSPSLKVLHRSSAIGSHSWLHLSPPKSNGTRNLYATAWTDPPTVVAYAVHSSTQISLLGTAQTQSRSGYVCASDVAVYSAGGATGEVFSLDPETGNFACSPPSSTTTTTTNGTPVTPGSTNGQSPIQPLQTLSFIDASTQRDDGSVMDFGGLRHGAHSADLSPDGLSLYVADIGRNCIWTFAISPNDGGKATLSEKHISPRPNDGPRHVWPHPSGGYVYCLQEHTSMVDVFATTTTTTSGANSGVNPNPNLRHEQGVRIIPPGQHEGDFWADEVRTSLSSENGRPKYLYASTRGLTPQKKGYVAVYKLTEQGRIDTSIPSPYASASERLNNGHTEKDVDNGNGNGNGSPYNGLLCMYETATSGGWANAIQPGPTVDGVEYLALTDSEEGWVFVLGWDGKDMKEVARTKLDNQGAGAATAVWL
ncbi:hypothetical protein LTR67_008923 [Exophiala xenobiotica]